MDVAKLGLSEEELRLVTDPGIILTKNAIIAKIYQLFGELSGLMQRDMVLPAEVAAIPPKISKGESYQGLPYVMLDYPRSFTVEHVLAIRTFFWWGNFFSVNLHLKGKYRDLCRNSLPGHFGFLAAEQYAISVSEDEWQHDTGTSDYRPLDSMSANEFTDLVQTLPFVKISKSFSFEHWENMPGLLYKAQQELGRIIIPLKG